MGVLQVDRSSILPFSVQWCADFSNMHLSSITEQRISLTDLNIYIFFVLGSTLWGILLSRSWACQPLYNCHFGHVSNKAILSIVEYSWPLSTGYQKHYHIPFSCDNQRCPRLWQMSPSVVDLKSTALECSQCKHPGHLTSIPKVMDLCVAFSSQMQFCIKIIKKSGFFV